MFEMSQQSNFRNRAVVERAGVHYRSTRHGVSPVTRESQPSPGLAAGAFSLLAVVGVRARSDAGAGAGQFHAHAARARRLSACARTACPARQGRGALLHHQARVLAPTTRRRKNEDGLQGGLLLERLVQRPTYWPGMSTSSRSGAAADANACGSLGAFTT